MTPPHTPSSSLLWVLLEAAHWSRAVVTASGVGVFFVSQRQNLASVRYSPAPFLNVEQERHIWAHTTVCPSEISSAVTLLEKLLGHAS